MTNEKLRIEEEKYERDVITVEHEGKQISFVSVMSLFIDDKIPFECKVAEHPAIIADKLVKENLQLPTFGQICSLAHRCLHHPNSCTRKTILYNDLRLLGFTGTLLTEKGLYIEDNPTRCVNEKVNRRGESYGRWFSMDLNDIERRLSNNDPSVRFVPKDRLERLFQFDNTRRYLEGKELTKLLEDDYLIALTGSKQTAEKVVEIAMMQDEPYLMLDIPLTKGIVSLSAFRFSAYTIFGNIWANDNREYSLGLRLDVK